MGPHERIGERMSQILEQYSDVQIVSPTSLALAVQRPWTFSNADAAYTSLEGLKQMARHHLRKRFDADGDASDATQGELFSGRLQNRYPTPHKRGEEPAYKLLDALASSEVEWNVRQLRASGNSRLMHADALQAWDQNRAVAA